MWEACYRHPSLESIPVSVSACLFATLFCVSVLVLKFILGVCARALPLLLDTACWGPGGHAEASPSPPPLPPPPLAGGWPWQGLTESWPGGGSMEIHASPLSQPTEPTHSVCAGVLMLGQTHARTHTCMHIYKTSGGPWASRCPYASFLCFSFLLDFSRSLLLDFLSCHLLFHFLFIMSSLSYSIGGFNTFPSSLIAMEHSESLRR